MSEPMSDDDMTPWLSHLTGTPAAEGTVTVGAPLANGVKAASREAVIEALKTVHDPEIPVDIYELGLIYDLEVGADGNVAIGMSLTAPACPVAGEMPRWVADAVSAIDGAGEVAVTLVWDPPWTPERMSDDAKMVLDFG